MKAVASLNHAKSALFGLFAGAVWMFWSIAFVGSAAKFWAPTVTVLALIVLSWSIFRVRFIRHRIASSADSTFANMFGWKFRCVVALEFLLAGGTVLFLISTHRSQMIPVAVAFSVGLHFLPLAKLFRMPTLYITGISMALIAAVSLAIPHANIRNVVVCVGVGISMWVRSLVALHR